MAKQSTAYLSYGAVFFSVSLSNKPAKVSTAVHLRKTATKPGVGPEVILHKHSEAAASAGEP